MRKYILVGIAIVFMVTGIGGCKSVETTSAMLHNQTGSYDKAIENAKLGLAKNPQDAEAYYQLGYSYSKKDSMRLAYENFIKATEFDPGRKDLVEINIKSNWAGHYNNGLNEHQLENLKGAAKEFEMATQADPRRLKSWLRLVRILSTLLRLSRTTPTKISVAAKYSEAPICSPAMTAPMANATTGGT